MQRNLTMLLAAIALALPLKPIPVSAEENAPSSDRFSAVGQRLEAVKARSARVADHNEVENLQRIFGYYFDKMLWDDVADLFAADATLEIADFGVYRGQESIRRFLFSLSGGKAGPIEGRLFDHMQLQPVVHVAADGKSAKGRWRAFIQTGTFGKSAHWGEGPYENAYIKEDGVWKIQSLHWYQTYFARYEDGWAEGITNAASAYDAPNVAAADLPPSRSYDPYGQVFAPPFHYENPVAGALVDTPGAASQEPALRSVAELESAIADAEREIARLEAVEEIENLISAYGFYVDKSMHDDVADLFARDGTLEILGRGLFVGPDRIRAYMHNLGPGGAVEGGLFNHMVFQPVIHVAEDGQTAKARYRLFVMFGRYERASQWGAGVYENDFVKEDGVWKFKKLHAFQTFYTNYHEGWGKMSSPLFAVFDRFPPDAPPTVQYDPYPAAFVPPFHYKNPVSGK